MPTDGEERDATRQFFWKANLSSIADVLRIMDIPFVDKTINTGSATTLEKDGFEVAARGGGGLQWGLE